MPDYPPAPWPLAGSLWLTLFAVRRDADPLRPAGLYGAAFVDYRAPSPLTYGEVLVARLVRDQRLPRVSITDIWVDSAASMAGGRELWAIPKGLADFESESVRSGPLTTTAWTARLEGRPVASARFRDVSDRAPRTPFRATLRQPGLADTGGEERTAPMRGTARTLPARARWRFAADGPLGWLRGAPQLGSFRLADFRMSFG